MTTSPSKKILRHVLLRYLVLPILVVMALVYTASRVFAHHDPNHKVLVLGEQSKLPVRIGVCDTMEQVKMLTDAGQLGLESFQAVYLMLSSTPNEAGEGVCGLLTDLIVPVEVVYTTAIGGKPLTVIKVMDSEGTTYFGLTNLPVVNAGQET